MAQEAQAITFPSKSLLHIANQCFQSGDLGLASAFYSIWDTLLLSGAETISLPRLRQMQIKPGLLTRRFEALDLRVIGLI